MGIPKTMAEVEEHNARVAAGKIKHETNNSNSGLRPAAPKSVGRRGSWAAGWRTIGGVEKYFRSRWEANYARFLEFQKSQGLVLSWQHEPETFWFDKVKRGCVSYLPDFKVTLQSGAIEFHEVKGWMDDKSKTKIKRMAKYHPEIKLVIKDSVWFKANSNLKGIIHDWE